MKAGWEIKTIGEVCEIRSGRNQKEVENPNGKYPIYGSGGIMGYADDYLCDAGATIIGRKGSINNPLFVETKFWNVDTAFGFSPKETVLPKYLFYFCKGFNFQAMNKGTTIPSLVKTDLLQIRIPISSLSEQQSIVDNLDQEFAKIDALKANAEKALQAAKDLFQATLKMELDGKTKETSTLLSLCQSIVDCPHSTPIKSAAKTNFPCIRTSELKDGKISWATMQYVSEAEYKKRITRLQPQAGDIVYGREGTIGDAVLLPTGYSFCLGQRTMLFRPNVSLIDPEYLLYCILSPFVYNQAMSKNTGCGVAHVNVADVKQFLIPIPKQKEEQRRIVSRLNSLNEKSSTLQDNYRKTLALCENLKQVLLRKAFNCELNT